MIELMDKKQLELCAQGGIGKSPVDIHVLSQHKIAEILIEFDVLKISAEEAVANAKQTAESTESNPDQTEDERREVIAKELRERTLVVLDATWEAWKACAMRVLG